jgi:hypothetical protein
MGDGPEERCAAAITSMPPMALSGESRDWSSIAAIIT